MISHYATELQNKAMPEEYETQAIRMKEAITLAWNLMARTTNIDEVSFSVLHRVGDALQDLGLVAEDFGAHSPRKGAGSHRDSRRPNMGWALDQILEKYTTTMFRVGLDHEGGYWEYLRGVLDSKTSPVFRSLLFTATDAEGIPLLRRRDDLVVCGTEDECVGSTMRPTGIPADVMIMA